MCGGLCAVVGSDDVIVCIDDATATAKRESRNSFGDDTLLIEKYFDDVRHIEFQIMGDQYGNVVHLNERECSVQRRHQKVIEEAPSVIMTPALRERMGHSAVAIGRAINYRGAGTVEFIADDQGTPPRSSHHHPIIL
jgi:acetyl/propionyl-CoA carboxylase alpha subunit